MPPDPHHIYRARDLDLIGDAFTRSQGKWARSLVKRAVTLAERLSPRRGRLRERIVEIPLTLAALGNMAPGRVADVGGASSLLGLQATYLGHEVHVFDLRPMPMTHPRLHLHQEDLFENDLPAGHFDALSCISVIEHVGMDRYGGPARPDGDLDFMAALHRLCRPGGTLLLSAPYGRGHDPTRDGAPHGYRVYDRGRLTQLMAAWEVRQLRFFVIRAGVWLETDQAEADTVATARPVEGVFWAELIRPA